MISSHESELLNISPAQMHPYQAPKSSLYDDEGAGLTTHPVKASIISCIWGCTLVAIVFGFILLVATAPDYKLGGIFLFVAFWLCSILVALLVTFTYGSLVHFTAVGVNLFHQATYILGGMIPGILILFYGIADMDKSTTVFGGIVVVYGFLIAYLYFKTLRRETASDT